MIKILSFTAILLSIFPSYLRADDISDAKAAFQTLVEYQKTDDPRSVSLFTDNCTVKFIYTDGTRTKERAFTPEEFHEWLTKVLALKHGNNDVYENIDFTQVDRTVKAAGIVHYTDTGLRGPISLVYSRDATGGLKIKEMTATIPIPPK